MTVLTTVQALVNVLQLNSCTVLCNLCIYSGTSQNQLIPRRQEMLYFNKNAFVSRKYVTLFKASTAQCGCLSISVVLPSEPLAHS